MTTVPRLGFSYSATSKKRVLIPLRTLTASDRSILTRLASSLPTGSRERRAILAGLAKRATEFSSKEELAKYLKDHPNADPKNHSVKESDKGGDERIKGESKSREIKSADGKDPHHVMGAAGGNKVFMGNYTVKHLQTHAQPGKGSVFSGKIKPEDISAAINKIPAKFFEEGGGAFEIDVPNAGSDLVQKSSDILKKYPNAKKITVPKQEGVVMGEDGKPKMGENGKPIPKMVDVTAYVVDDGDDAFSTNKMTVVLRPANPQFMPEEAKKDEELSGALNDKKGFAVLTAFPGKKDVPKASEWGDEYAIIVPNGGKGADEDVQKALGSSKKGSVTPHPQDFTMRKLSSSDRSALIRLASSLPEGSPERKAILASLDKTANQSSALADSLKKKWRNVTYDPKQNQGRASLGALKITFRESGNDNAVIVTINEMPYLKADAESAEKILDAINDAFRMA